MKIIPELLSTVRLTNRGEVYLVVDVNHCRKEVEVISVTETPHLIPDVPVSRIQEVIEGPPIYM